MRPEILKPSASSNFCKNCQIKKEVNNSRWIRNKLRSVVYCRQWIDNSKASSNESKTKINNKESIVNSLKSLKTKR